MDGRPSRTCRPGAPVQPPPVDPAKGARKPTARASRAAIAPSLSPSPVEPRGSPSLPPSGVDPLVKDPARYKTVMCQNWVARGSCPYGHKCQFAHGGGELRKGRGRVKGGAKRGSATAQDDTAGSRAPRRCSDPTLWPTPAATLARQREPSPSSHVSPSAGTDRSPSPLCLPRPFLPWPRLDTTDRLGFASLPSAASTTSAPPTPPTPPFSARLAPQPPQLSLPPSPLFSPALHSPGLGSPLSSLLGSPSGYSATSPTSPPTQPRQQARAPLLPLMLSPVLAAHRMPMAVREVAYGAGRSSSEWSDARTVLASLDSEPSTPKDELEDECGELLLWCNPETGKVELALPPHVSAREVSHNTLSVRRSISLLWNDDESALAEAERERNLADETWCYRDGDGLSNAAQHATLADALLPATLDEALRHRESRDSSARYSQCSSYASAADEELPPCAPALDEPLFGRHVPPWRPSVAAENVARQLDFLFSDRRETDLVSAT